MTIKTVTLLVAVVLCVGGCAPRRPTTTHGPSLHGAKELNRQQYNDVQDAKDSVRNARTTNDQIEAKLIRLERGDYER